MPSTRVSSKNGIEASPRHFSNPMMFPLIMYFMFRVHALSTRFGSWVPQCHTATQQTHTCRSEIGCGVDVGWFHSFHVRTPPSVALANRCREKFHFILCSHLPKIGICENWINLKIEQRQQTLSFSWLLLAQNVIITISVASSISNLRICMRKVAHVCFKNIAWAANAFPLLYV